MAFAKPASLVLNFLRKHNIPIEHDKPNLGSKNKK